MNWLWEEDKITLLGKQFTVIDFAVAVVLIVVGLVWLIGLIVYLYRRKRKTEMIVKQQKPKVTTPGNDLEAGI